jgi:hypothetical protein
MPTEVWVFCNKTNPYQNITIVIKASVLDNSNGYYWESISENGDEKIILNTGWNRIKIDSYSDN